MKPFSQLTLRGKARRLRRVALAALPEFGLDVATVELLGMATNALFRVRAHSGKAYVLRCCAPGWRTDTDLESEALWLEALARDTDIGAPEALRTRDGDAIARVAVEGLAGPNRVTMMGWIPGVLLGKRLSTENLAKMGDLFARMHAHGAAFVAPPGFTTRRMASYLARDEPDVLFGDETQATLPSHHRELLQLTRARVDAAFADLYADPRGLQVIHNDLWHDNIKVHRGRLRPLDFEDTIWGYPVQDIAMAFQDLADDVPPDAYEPYVDAFRAGYERRAPWPERTPGQIDAFRVGRLLWVSNYVARHEAQYLQDHVDRLAPRLEGFLATGRVGPQNH